MPADSDLQRRAIKDLGYPEAWLALGLLDDSLLGSQLASLDLGTNPHCEHYRYAAFLVPLQRELSPVLVTRFLELASANPDPAMATSAVLELLEAPELRVAAFTQIAGHPLLLEHQMLVRRAALRRALRHEGPVASVVDAILESGDATVQLQFLGHPSLSPASIRLVAERGVSAKVRRLAGARSR